MSPYQKFFAISALLFFSLFSKTALAIESVETPSQVAKVVKILEQKDVDVMGATQLYQKLLLKIESTNQEIIIENGHQPLTTKIQYRPNDRLIVTQTSAGNGPSEYVIVDFVRTDGLVLLTIIFIILIIFIAKGKGISSVFGMIFTFLTIFYFVLPRILAGNNPIIVVALSCMLIIPVSFYLAHGYNKKTTVAIIGSIVSLILTSIFAFFFIKICHLTGLSSEEAGLLSQNRESLNMTNILLAGIVVGALGVLDDITISQSAIVDELSTTAKLTKFSDLYSRAMVIGKDHITSTVNTLVLAYAGASMPLMLLFVGNPHPFTEVINYEIVAEEIVRTIVGSIGLVLAVPITTFLAAYWYQKNNSNRSFK